MNTADVADFVIMTFRAYAIVQVFLAILVVWLSI